MLSLFGPTATPAQQPLPRSPIPSVVVDAAVKFTELAELADPTSSASKALETRMNYAALNAGMYMGFGLIGARQMFIVLRAVATVMPAAASSVFVTVSASPIAVPVIAGAAVVGLIIAVQTPKANPS